MQVIKCNSCDNTKAYHHFTKAMVREQIEAHCFDCRQEKFIVCTECDNSVERGNIVDLRRKICIDCFKTGDLTANSGITKRDCLKCDITFLAKSKFIRMCDRCKSDQDICEDWMTGE